MGQDSLSIEMYVKDLASPNRPPMTMTYCTPFAHGCQRYFGDNDQRLLRLG